jgi:hypothetical protein
MMKLAFASGGHSDTDLVVRERTWAEFKQRLREPKVGEKDGPYVLRGGLLSSTSRSNEALQEAALLVLDGDSRIDPETGEIIAGSPGFDQTRQALDELGYTYALHTTWSYVPGVLEKWRIFIPAIYLRQELDAVVNYLIEQLRGCGVYINDVKENHTWAQPWYLSRVPKEHQLAFRFAEGGDAEFPVQRAVELEHAARQAEAAIAHAQAPQPPRQHQGDSIIEAFNQAASMGWVRQQLEAAGYKFAGRQGRGLRFIAPGSESGTPGVNVFKGGRGDVVAYSHHGAHDPLSHRLTDAFGMYALFQHGGDLKAAAKTLQQDAGTGNQRDPLAGFEEEQVDFRQARLEAAATAANAGPTPADKFQWITRLTGSSPVLNGNWLIKRVLPAEGLGVIYGRPGSGKTFSVMDIAMHISVGLTWRGQKTARASVSYVSPEAGRLGANRVIGWCRHHDIAWPDTFRLSPAQIDLSSADTDADALIADIKASQPDCRLVVIDTLNRAMAGGDENSGEDMGNFVRLCDKIGKALNAFVLVVHHSGKDAAKGSRGHSSLLGAVSLELEVSREQGQPGVIKVTKMRDGEDGAEYGFAIGSVELGHDEDGEVVSTGISVSADAGEVRTVRDARPQGTNQHTVAAAFDQLMVDEGKPTPFGTGFPEAGQFLCVGTDRLIGFAVGKMASGGKDHIKRKAMAYALEGLRLKGYFATNGGYTWKII